MEMTTIWIYDVATGEYLDEIEAIVGGTPNWITWKGKKYRVQEIGWDLDAVRPDKGYYRATIEIYIDTSL